MRAFNSRSLSILLFLLAALPLFASSATAQERGRERHREAPPSTQSPNVKILPPGHFPEGDYWRLGVSTDILDVGERIREVAPRSAAARVGLERDDIIVSVNGYQVGRVGNVYYPLEDELQRQPNSRGEVRLLVQDRRSARLINIDVRLDRVSSRAREAIVRGEVFFRERMALPADAELRLELQRRTPFSRDTIAETVLPHVGNPPIGFEFRYPIDLVRPDETYDLRAEIWHRGHRLYVSDGRYPIRPGIDESGVRILMRRD